MVDQKSLTCEDMARNPAFALWASKLFAAYPAFTSINNFQMIFGRNSVLSLPLAKCSFLDTKLLCLLLHFTPKRLLLLHFKVHQEWLVEATLDDT